MSRRFGSGERDGKISPKIPERDHINIYGPRNDGSYTVEFATMDGRYIAVNVPFDRLGVIRHFQARYPYGLAAPGDHADDDELRSE